MTCAICGIRKPRRSCPGVNADICSICCGTGREETIDCPLTCEYLQDAHSHENPEPVAGETLPNAEIDLPEEFLEKHEWVLILLGAAALEGAGQSPGITDYDMREAFGKLIDIYRASASGLYVEALPVNPFAATVVAAVQARMAELKKRELEAQGQSSLQDAIVMKMVVFLQRMEYANNNHRRKSRAFLDFLQRFYAAGPEELEELEEPEPDAPRIIL